MAGMLQARLTHLESVQCTISHITGYDDDDDDDDDDVDDDNDAGDDDDDVVDDDDGDINL